MNKNSKRWTASKSGQALTKSLLSKKSKGVFQCSCFPPIEIKVVGKKCDHFALFSMPVRCPPKAVKQFLLPQSNIKQSACHRILLILAHILIPSNDLHLFDLCERRELATMRYMSFKKSTITNKKSMVTIVSFFRIHRKIPSDLASDHVMGFFREVEQKSKSKS